MCGILGTLPATPSPVLKKALDRIAHRGPDGYGIWQGGEQGITLGHRRLAILDISEDGNQPMHFQHLTITYNGEIYNFLEIRKHLEKEGYQFRSLSDTEVILAAYHHWGVECLQRFNGMWAIAIWDQQKKELFLARDRFGQKPLFYAFVDHQFIFASEMKAILPFLPRVVAASHFDWCAKNIFLYENTDKCLVEGIQRFPPAHYGYLTVNKRTIDFTCYWDTFDHLPEIPTTYEDQVSAFRDLFLDACKIRMRSDVPVGTALSGGLDSSSVISAMAHVAQLNKGTERVTKDWQHAFVAAFPGMPIDETYFAQQVVEHIGISATIIDMEHIASVENLEKSIQLFEEIYLTSPVPMVGLYGAIKKQGISVSIDGHGADELLAGYGNSLFTAFPDCGWNAAQIKSILATRQALHPKGTQLSAQTYNWTDYIRHMLGHFFLIGKDTLQNASSSHNLRKKRNKVLGSYNRHLYELFHQTIMPTLLRNYDRYSMINGVEIRMPFLDHRVVAFLFAIPWSSKLKNGFTKNILRDAAAPFTASTIIKRRTKVGFNTPFEIWMKSHWKTYLLDTIHSKDFEECPLIDAPSLRSMVLLHLNKPKPLFSDGQKVWKAMNPFLWEKHFLKNYRQ